MKSIAKPLPLIPMTFTRADPELLHKFDPSTKHCVMNCGRHRDDPRSAKECKFLCDDCVPSRYMNL